MNAWYSLTSSQAAETQRGFIYKKREIVQRAEAFCLQMYRALVYSPARQQNQYL